MEILALTSVGAADEVTYETSRYQRARSGGILPTNQHNRERSYHSVAR